VLGRLGRWSARHRWWVLGAWVVALAAIALAGRAAGGSPSDDLSVPGMPAAVGARALAQAFPGTGASSGQIVLHVPPGRSLRDPGAARAVRRSIAAVARVPGVVGVSDPLRAPGGLARDGRTALATVTWKPPPGELGEPQLRELERATAPARAAGVEVAFGGSPAEGASGGGDGPSELIGLAAAVVILLLAFGSAVAMALPLVSALLGLGTALSILTVLEAVADVNAVAPTLATMIGLGVGIDYALFVVTRHLQGLAGGLSVTESIGRAVAGAGRAVLIAGATVAVALLGLGLAGIPFVTVLGEAAALAVAVAVCAALTLLPATLAIAGRGVQRARVPGLRGPGPVRLEGPDGRPHGWACWAAAVARRPVLAGLASLAVLLALAVPALSMSLGQVGAGSDPPGSTTRRAYDLVSAAFGPGANGPIVVALEGPDVARAAGRAALAARRDPDVASAAPPEVARSGLVASLTLIPRSGPSDPRTAALVRRLPGELGPAAGTARVEVTGLTAGIVDVSDRVSERLPWFVGAVIAISFLLLMAVFRSVLVPLKAALMNLLSIGAAFGALVAVFQWGWGAGLLGIQGHVAIEAWVPMMMFAILFGLSMDYEVFLLARIREDWLASGDGRRSVAVGLTATARVIGAAALIMTSVFLAFVGSPNVVVTMMGVGLATAVLVDATLVRLVLVPATMVLLGRANWWLPRGLGRLLPRLSLEGPDAAGSAALARAETAAARAEEPDRLDERGIDG
jgi:RND superfamily putative drug exporter